MSGKTIVFIHGLFMTYRCWDGWLQRFQNKGYTCVAVPYPGREKTVTELRKAHPDPEVGKLTFDSVLAHHEAIIKAMPEPPILIGHSMGGLLTQVLLNRGLGAGGVAISTAPPQGLLSFKFSFFRSNWAALNPLNPTNRPYVMPFSAFQYAFVNGLPEPEQRAIYEEHVPPEALGIPRGVLSSRNAKIDFARAHAPLLIIGGGIDHIIPVSLVRANAARYKASSSITDYKEFPDRNHYGFAQKGWEPMADFVEDWIKQQGI